MLFKIPGNEERAKLDTVSFLPSDTTLQRRFYDTYYSSSSNSGEMDSLPSK